VGSSIRCDRGVRRYDEGLRTPQSTSQLTGEFLHGKAAHKNDDCAERDSIGERLSAKEEVSQIGRGTAMISYLDIFRIESSGVLWCGAVTTVETAEERIQKLADSSPGSYLILNQTTGQRIVVTPGLAEQN
jgi:hypothetical protein